MTALNPALAAEIQKLAPSAKIELFEIDLTALGDAVYRFHAGTNDLSQALVWQGQVYRPWSCTASGFDYSGTGPIARPKLALANHLGSITGLLLAFKDCLRGKVTRRRTLAKFLDAANFPGGVNATADPTAGWPDEVFFIDRKAREDKNVVEFELTAAFDVTGVMLPRRQIIQSVCPWRYRGPECGYAGDACFSYDDSPVPDEALDVCGKRLSSCKVRFGENAELPFGGFPGTGLIT